MSIDIQSLNDLTLLEQEFSKKMVDARHIISNFNDVISYTKEGIYSVKYKMDTCNNSFSLRVTFKLKEISTFDVVNIIKEKRNCLIIRDEYSSGDVHGFYFDYKF